MLVAVIGTGLVGGEFIKQLVSIPPETSPFSLVSLTSSTRTLWTPENPVISAASWKSSLAGATEKPDLQKLTKDLAQLISPSTRAAIIDNTSSDDVAAMYPVWLKAGINVITPNKKAYSGDLGLYEKILAASKESGARFLNESTVGAGLPVISTLKELVATGDKIKKIEGVFSGTMSYIFNEFSTGSPDGPSFSSVVSIAREKGYTEPHPADDLNGFDVARKLTILSRTISLNPASSSPTSLPSLQSFASVQTTSLIPKPLEGIPAGDEFLARLPEFDAEFDKMRKEASAEGKVLRFVGVVDPVNGQVKAGLEKYPVDHPFATSLGGSDNIIMFHTERYSPRPLIVQGAGAGAAVTAMGVLGDLLKLM
ncbi:aspartate kinase homoserine dehydrogenase [Dendrothele bispora CBS 962.96]|uniref:Homoserine dehydrogenase n=1 Tax=Dendrothele bispora (strain CBS 962.96) TaxID=1314807 RepID=A0A4S8MHS9_DENBC|nr:aspartate kinase homoserine dehydrogenase [Dendrothele bispora CBS 962.96]